MPYEVKGEVCRSNNTEANVKGWPRWEPVEKGGHWLLSPFSTRKCIRVSYPMQRNVNDIDTNNMKCSWPTRAPMRGYPTQPIYHLLVLGFALGGNANVWVCKAFLTPSCWYAQRKILVLGVRTNARPKRKRGSCCSRIWAFEFWYRFRTLPDFLQLPDFWLGRPPGFAIFKRTAPLFHRSWRTGPWNCHLLINLFVYLILIN